MSYPVWIDLGSSSSEAWRRGSDLNSGTWTEIGDLQSIEVVLGTPYNDVIKGGTAGGITGVVLDGGAGNDELYAGFFASTLRYSSGHDVFHGALEATADFSKLARPIWVDMTSSGVDAWTRGATLQSGTWTEAVDLIDVPNLIGTDFDDYLVGSAVSNRINGGKGSDLIAGGLGQDFLRGGDGADVFAFRTLAEASDRIPANGFPLNYDSLEDFVSGTDKIDLSAIVDANETVSGNQHFTWSNSGAAGTVTFGSPSGGAGGLLLFVDGTAGADYFLWAGGLTIDQGDVIL